MQRLTCYKGLAHTLMVLQRRDFRILLCLSLFISSVFLSLTTVARAEAGTVSAYLFWQEGCPYCAKAHADLEALAKQRPQLDFKPLELGTGQDIEARYEAVLAHFGYAQAAVPLVVIGERSYMGHFDGGESARRYAEAVESCVTAGCTDIVAQLGATGVSRGSSEDIDNKNSSGDREAILPEFLELPLIGKFRPAELSLPALTVLLAAIDGFNPCAMWVLVFLIGLLVGLKDEKRMWILGAAFLSATAAMYFAVMAAWLNLVLFLGAIVWFRVAIGLLAIGAGLYFLKEYWSKPEAVCEVTDPGQRQRIMSAFRTVVGQHQLVLSILGIAALAVAVNFIELLCSAGIPAVYTQILALNKLSPASNYSYISLYIAVFMLDDIAIFATAMLALKATGLTGAYARFSHLIGGIVLLSIGAVLLLRPELLALG